MKTTNSSMTTTNQNPMKENTMTQQTQQQTQHVEHFIDGRRTPGTGEATQEIYNPATGEVSGILHLASEEDLQATVAAARTAASRPAPSRARARVSAPVAAAATATPTTT